MIDSQWFVLSGVLVGGLGFYGIWRYAEFFRRHFGVIFFGIFFFSLVLLPSIILVAPFVKNDSTIVPVTIESISKSSNRRQLFYNVLLLSTKVNGEKITDAWTVPASFGPFQKDEVVEGLMVSDNAKVELAIRRVIRFPFSASQLIIALFLGIAFYVIFVEWVHNRRLESKSTRTP